MTRPVGSGSRPGVGAADGDTGRCSSRLACCCASMTCGSSLLGCFGYGQEVRGYCPRLNRSASWRQGEGSLPAACSTWAYGQN